jgi:serpin B
MRAKRATGLFCLGLALALMASISAGCVSKPGPGENETQLARTPAPPTSAGTADLEALVSGDDAFALELYQALRSQPGNLFFSPYSISAALAMVYAGARGETEAQMAQTLHFDLPQADLHASFRALAEELARRGQGAQGTDEKGFRLDVVNALWGQKGYKFLEEYLSLLSAYYGAEMQRVNYSQPEKARAAINDWVSKQTEERIKDLIPPGGVDDRTRLVLTNAIYFNAAWANPFWESATADGPFTRLDGSQVTVPMMSRTASSYYAAGDGYQAVELPYDRWETSMVILLPEKDKFEEFEASLDGAKLKQILAGLGSDQVALTMPKFEFDAEFSLADALSAMGMPVAFAAGADLSGMTREEDLFISDVFHKAFVSVDENGTEAAASTAVVAVPVSSNPPKPVEVKVDRPFLFLIRDVETDAILFLGRVVDPGA